jgi:hypothetical protein
MKDKETLEQIQKQLGKELPKKEEWFKKIKDDKILTDDRIVIEKKKK